MMVWNPFKGGTYDLSKLGSYARYLPAGVAYTALTDPTWYDRAASNVGSRVASGNGLSSVLPQTLWHGQAMTANSSQGNSGTGSSQTDDTNNNLTDDTGNTGGGSGNLSEYLSLINKQRNTLQGQYETGFADANASAGRQGLAIQSRANQGIFDIDTSLAETEKQGSENSQMVRSSADTARYNTKEGINRSFGARGAIDSSYYQRALSAGLADINTQERTQITYITQALDKAKNEATRQKSQIKMELDIALQDLESKRASTIQSLKDQYDQGMISLAQLEYEAGSPITKYASADEISKIQSLADTNYQIDNYLTNIDNQAQTALSQIKSSATATKQAGVDMTNVNTLLGSLSKGLKAGYRKADFVPMLVSKGYSPEQAQSILDKAELWSSQGV